MLCLINEHIRFIAKLLSLTNQLGIIVSGRLQVLNIIGWIIHNTAKKLSVRDRNVSNAKELPD